MTVLNIDTSGDFAGPAQRSPAHNLNNSESPSPKGHVGLKTKYFKYEIMKYNHFLNYSTFGNEKLFPLQGNFLISL